MMHIKSIDFDIQELHRMKKYPQKLYYVGETALLDKKKVAIVGSRKPNQYARELTYEIALKLANHGVCIVSGGALGTDIIAHKAAGFSNTIMVAGTGLDKHYPAINKNTILEIEKNGLVLSQFKEGTPSQRYNFPLRNELVVALGDILIVMYADENSGTMRSVEYAQAMGKDIYVLSHRVGESVATQKLLQCGVAKAICDVDSFIESLIGKTSSKKDKSDDFLEFCKNNPSYDAVVKKFPSRVFEAELKGEIKVVNARVYVT